MSSTADADRAPGPLVDALELGVGAKARARQVHAESSRSTAARAPASTAASATATTAPCSRARPARRGARHDPPETATGGCGAGAGTAAGGWRGGGEESGERSWWARRRCRAWAVVMPGHPARGRAGGTSAAGRARPACPGNARAATAVKRHVSATVTPTAAPRSLRSRARAASRERGCRASPAMAQSGFHGPHYRIASPKVR